MNKNNMEIILVRKKEIPFHSSLSQPYTSFKRINSYAFKTAYVVSFFTISLSVFKVGNAAKKLEMIEGLVQYVGTIFSSWAHAIYETPERNFAAHILAT